MTPSTRSKAAPTTKQKAQKSSDKKSTGKKPTRKKPAEKKTDKKKKSNKNDAPNPSAPKAHDTTLDPLNDVTTTVNNTQPGAHETRRPANGACHSKNHKENNCSTRDDCVDPNLEPYNCDDDLEAPTDDFDGPTDEDIDEDTQLDGQPMTNPRGEEDDDQDPREFTSAPRNYSSGRDEAEAVDVRRSPMPQQTSIEDRPRVPNLPSDSTIEDDNEAQGSRMQASRSNRNASQEVSARSQLRIANEDADNDTTNKKKNSTPRHLKRRGNVWEHEYYDHDDGKHGDSEDGDYYDYDDDDQENGGDFHDAVDDDAESDVGDDNNPEESQRRKSGGKRSRRPDNNKGTVYDLSELDLRNETNPFICFSPDGLIAKPAGEPGRATRGKKRGYCLRRAMGYPPELPKDHPGRKNKTWRGKNKAYNSIHLYARQVIDQCFEPDIPFLQQKPSRRVKAEKAWLAKFPQFSTTYERNWPMNVMFSTIMQNNKKRKQKVKASKTSEGGEEEEEEEEEINNTFAISLPGGKLLGKATNEFDIPSSSTLASSPGPVPPSTRSNQPKPAAKTSKPNPAPQTSQPRTTMPASTRNLGFQLQSDPPAKVKKTESKKTPAGQKRKRRENDDSNVDGPEKRAQKSPQRPPHKERPRVKGNSQTEANTSRHPQNKRQRVLDSEDEVDKA
ncbi:hypothetical protein FRB90_002171 [Tulasnella sp. 427]|nr:hypothetical protein FRB90_002171 [Tulasnella sp. 427]